MLSKLQELEEKFLSLESEMSDPKVAQDRERYRKLAKEHADISEIMRVYNDYKDLLRQISDNKALAANDPDPAIREMAKVELTELEEKAAKILHKITLMLLPKDTNDEKNIILEIRAGTGGDEAALFAADLFRMYSRYAERKRWRVEILSSNETGIGGFKEIIALISGDRVYSRLKYESGIHRVQRVPETESQGRIHTSAVTVAVMPEADEVDVDIDPSEIKVDVYRASGAGGQHVNKTESAVRLTHIPTGIVVQCQDERSQHKNKAKAMKILYARILEMKKAAQQAQLTEERRNLVGTGDRSGRIRTYNFPQGRVTDHRIGLTLYRLESFMDGDIDEMIEALGTHYQTQALAGSRET
ncbi:peptide chain release factor 1 [Dissulfurimicrobium hydrothermale]|uniref:peptide chain release factor 1 n=1 Tax=Dissulfurimicrobium hydrothermale TaxID=1750598 RepID=UPI001EDB3030|nr:peptide chain release factor 1 [Dissulfurimicrobium hydrothermale]UKL13653.1 peptide chain release factor 1 [Dissulfurimicrobium hydrothermale]